MRREGGREGGRLCAVCMFIYLSRVAVRDDDCNVNQIFHKTSECTGKKTSSKPDTRDCEERHILFMMSRELKVKGTRRGGEEGGTLNSYFRCCYICKYTMREGGGEGEERGRE